MRDIDKGGVRECDGLQELTGGTGRYMKKGKELNEMK